MTRNHTNITLSFQLSTVELAEELSELMGPGFKFSRYANNVLAERLVRDIAREKRRRLRDG